MELLKLVSQMLTKIQSCIIWLLPIKYIHIQNLAESIKIKLVAIILASFLLVSVPFPSNIVPKKKERNFRAQAYGFVKS